MEGKRRLERVLLAIGLALLLGLTGVVSSEKSAPAKWLGQNDPGLYRVIEVDDGDTITVDMAGVPERVRLIGVDTPELHHPEKPVQCFAEAAQAFTARLIGEQAVRLTADPLDDNRDLYGRLLRYVYLPDGTLVNTAIVAQGYGFAYTHFPFTKVESVRALERQARKAGRGLWSSCTIENDGRNLQTGNAR